VCVNPNFTKHLDDVSAAESVWPVAAVWLTREVEILAGELEATE
jgi:hypothetical protein